MDDDQKPDWKQEERGEYAKEAHPAQISPHKRGLPVLLCMLTQIKESRRQYHHAGRRIHEHNNPAFQQMRCNDVRTLRVTHQRVRVPAPVNDRLLQLLIRQGNAVNVDRFDLFADGIDLRFIHDIIDVGDTHVGTGSTAYTNHL
ncbi:hypothetical protein D3C81_1416280 [compost metagenome]